MTTAQTAKRGRGWPKGRTRESFRTITDTVGAWAWNRATLWQRIIAAGEDECWAWRGSTTPWGNIFGAYKNNHAQMTQANRLIWMTLHQEDIDSASVKMTCHNRFCSNPSHMELVPYNKRRRIDGRTRAARGIELPPKGKKYYETNLG